MFAALGCGSGAVVMPSQSEEEPIISVFKMPADFRGEYHFFADDQTNETILFSTTESVENFAYMEIYPFIDPNDDLLLILGETLFGLDDFTFGKPIVIST